MVVNDARQFQHLVQAITYIEEQAQIPRNERGFISQAAHEDILRVDETVENLRRAEKKVIKYSWFAAAAVVAGLLVLRS